MEIPNKLNMSMIHESEDLQEASYFIEVYLDGVMQTHVYGYDVERGYVDKYQLKRHNQGCEVLYSVMHMNGRTLCNRLFGKVEVKWKS